MAFSLKAAQDQIRQLDNDLDSSKTQLISGKFHEFREFIIIICKFVSFHGNFFHVNIVQQENDDLTKAVNDRETEIHELASKLENMLSSNEDLSLSR